MLRLMVKFSLTVTPFYNSRKAAHYVRCNPDAMLPSFFFFF